MHWIFCVKSVDLGDSCTVGGDPAMNIIIARVPVLNVSEFTSIIISMQPLRAEENTGRLHECSIHSKWHIEA